MPIFARDSVAASTPWRSVFGATADHATLSCDDIDAPFNDNRSSYFFEEDTGSYTL